MRCLLIGTLPSLLMLPAGNPPAVAQPKEQKPAAVPEGFGKKARKRQAQAKGRMRGLGQGLEPQVDLEAERARIKVRGCTRLSNSSSNGQHMIMSRTVRVPGHGDCACRVC